MKKKIFYLISPSYIFFKFNFFISSDFNFSLSKYRQEMFHTVHLLSYKSFIAKYYSSLFHYYESMMYKLRSEE